ncbi:methyltransferase domain-containing protein [Candidatus Peregrinibacteria bacterium]|nr:methyltransferase domain-containing protein [Candidatus Peregrinibacteria bacterium]
MMKIKEVLRKVKLDYGLIAEEFSKTRQKPWPEFKVFLKSLNLKKARQKIKLLDAGCGGGRLYDFLKNEPIIYTGIDNNKNFLNLARRQHKKVKFKCADLTRLPFPKDSFDAVWCIAVLHHLPKNLQLKALKEICRVLTPKGKFMITVWDLWQKKYCKFINKKTHEALIPWGKKLNRYYYAFTADELKTLFKKAGFALVKNIRSKHNLAYIYEKS